MAKQFFVRAKVSVSKEEFYALNVDESLVATEEKVIEETEDDFTITLFRRINAENEEKAKEKARNGKLEPNVRHELEEIIEVKRIDEPL